MVEITSIEMQKNRKDRVNIYVDGEFFCGTQIYVVVKNNLKQGQQIDKHKLEQIILESEKNDALNKVAKLLEKTVKTEKQIRTYLKEKGYGVQTIDHVVAKLVEYKYIDDAAYMEMYIRSYSKKYGKQKMKSELLLKGIKKDIIEARLEEFDSPEDVLKKLADKYMKNKEITPQNLQKLRNHLASKGFEWDEISNVVNKYRRED